MTWRAERGSDAMGSRSARVAIFLKKSPAPNKLKFPLSYSQPAVLEEAEVVEAAVKPKTAEVSVGGEATGGGTVSPVQGGLR